MNTEGNNEIIITNPQTICHFAGTHVKNSKVIPHRMSMISIVHCDYDGQINEGEKVIGICCPHDNMTGIVCKKIHIDLACRDIIIYCHKNGMYPISKDTLNKFGLDGNVNVRRSNGHIDSRWIIKCNSSTYTNINGDIIIDVELIDSSVKNMGKYVELKDLCQLNNCNYDDLMTEFANQLNHFYDDKLEKIANQCELD